MWKWWRKQSMRWWNWKWWRKILSLIFQPSVLTHLRYLISMATIYFCSEAILWFASEERLHDASHHPTDGTDRDVAMFKSRSSCGGEREKQVHHKDDKPTTLPKFPAAFQCKFSSAANQQEVALPTSIITSNHTCHLLIHPKNTSATICRNQPAESRLSLHAFNTKCPGDISVVLIDLQTISATNSSTWNYLKQTQTSLSSSLLPS